MQAWPLRSFCSASLSSLDRPLYASDAAVARSRLKIKHQQRSTGFVRGWTRVLCFYSRFLAIEKKNFVLAGKLCLVDIFLFSYSAWNLWLYSKKQDLVTVKHVFWFLLRCFTCQFDSLIRFKSFQYLQLKSIKLNSVLASDWTYFERDTIFVFWIIFVGTIGVNIQHGRFKV